MKKSLIALFAALLVFPLFAQSQADRDAPKRDVFVMLDVSGSMINESKFVNVQDYLDREVIDGLLKNGDEFNLITFGDAAVERFSRTINSDADKAALYADIRKLEADNDYTDIGMAMEKLAEVVEPRTESGVRRVIFFITDGLNAPPPNSPYSGKDLSLDERFKSLGEKISRGGWFFYVIGIGGQTDAAAIAGAVPGSEYLTTDSSLEGVDISGNLARIDEEERAKLEAEEAARKAQAENAGIAGFFRGIASSLGVSLPVLFGGLAVILLLLLLILFLLLRMFRTIEIIITDEKETLIKKFGPFAGVSLNSTVAVLPGIGSENNQVFRIQRSAFGIKIKTLDSDAIADNSPYRKGTNNLKGVINLANGCIIRVTKR